MITRKHFAALAALIFLAVFSAPAVAADYWQFSYSSQILGLPSLGGPLVIYTVYWVASDAASVTLNIQTTSGAMGYTQDVVQGASPHGNAIFCFPVAPWEIVGAPQIVEHAVAVRGAMLARKR